MKKVFLAIGESRNFSFKALGSTEAQALDNLTKGLTTHGEQYQIDPEWFKEWADIYAIELTMGACYRDNSEIKA